jgi:hypothetical protein
LADYGCRWIFNDELKMTDSRRLLADYVENGSEAALREPVSRYLNLVQTRLRQENQSLRQQIGGLAQLKAENGRLSNLLAQAESSQLSQDQQSELMKLRGEVGLLRRQTNELGSLREDNRRWQASLAAARPNAESARADSVAERQKEMGIAKMNDAKVLVLGMTLYANDHRDQYPTNFDQIAPFFTKDPNDAAIPNLTGTNQFEIVYQGSIAEITEPMSAIVIREKQPWPGAIGGWSRTYGFADGHCEIHASPDGNFAPWEQEHIMPPGTGGQQ